MWMELLKMWTDRKLGGQDSDLAFTLESPYAAFIYK